MCKHTIFTTTMAMIFIIITGCAVQMTAKTTSDSRPLLAQTGSTIRDKNADELDLSIREASTYLNDNLPAGSKIVILNIESSSAPLSEYIIDELISNAVNDRNFSVVDRRQLDDIQSEQLFQLSGAVDDNDALSIGKFFGAQTIISGTIREIGRQHRLTIRALAVQTAQVQAQQSWNLVNSPMLIALRNNNVEILPSSTAPQTITTTGGGITKTTTIAGGVTTQTTTATATPTPTLTLPSSQVEPTLRGIQARGNTLADKLLWLDRSVDSGNTYIVEANADETIAPYTFLYRGAVRVTIILKGDSQNRIITLGANDNMFSVGENVTLTLDNNITLQGHKHERGSMVRVNPNGKLIMNAGSTIRGNNISAEYEGSAVYLYGGSFTMNGGTITGNTAIKGGGVYIGSGGDFIMTGGTISSNTAKNGAGVYIDYGTFAMRDGMILANIAREYGAGVSTNYHNPGHMIDFSKTGGVITAYNSDKITGNVVMDEEGNILARRGHAVFRREDMRKETTSGASNRMSLKTDGFAGGWDQ